MCNLYSVTKSQAAIIALTRAMRNNTGNLPPMPAIFPDYTAPIVRNAPDGVRELTLGRWGMPCPPQFGSAAVTNIRNTKSAHWRRWLGLPNRCLVPFTSFCEYADTKPKKTPTWFALTNDGPLAVFAGIWCTWNGKVESSRGRTCAVRLLNHRGKRRGGTGSLEGHASHPHVGRGIESWMTAPAEEALKLQRSLPDGMLQIVARGERKDEALAVV
jgi:putative SOS response-associated peptidase YedK